MPFRVKCRHCGEIIFKCDDILSPDEVLSKFNGRCPKCGKKLRSFPADVKIYPKP